MTVKMFTFNPFQTNCFVCHDGSEAVIVDPSAQTPREQQAVVDYLEQHDLSVRHLLLTHAHIDHILGCAFFSEQYGQAFQMHRIELPFITQGRAQAVAFGVDLEPPPTPDVFLDEGDTLAVGEATWRVLHTPGHSPGSICFYDEANGFIISGDVLFMGSIGRTEGLPQTSLPQLMQSIFHKLMPLPDATTVYPGHGPATTIGRERQHNPFLTSGFFTQ